MSNLLIAEILILVCLLPVVLRSVFIRSHRVDSIVLFSPLSFVLNIILWFVYGLSFSIFWVSVLNLLIMLSNFRALLRYFDGLFVSYYSIKFRVAMFIEGMIVVFFLVVLCIFAPVAMDTHETRIFYGSCARGFTETNSFFKPKNLFLTKFEASAEGEKKDFSDKPIILYVPSPYSSTYDATPRLEAIAAKGYVVVSAEFYTDDCKCFGNLLDLRMFRPSAMRLFNPNCNFEDGWALEKEKALQLVNLIYGKAVLYESDIVEPAALMDDIYLTHPLEAYIMDKENYKKIKKIAKLVPSRIADRITEINE